MSRVVMITACHKACPTPADELYLPVHVGSVGNDSIGFQRDDEGDNISNLNPKYCELTGLYWAWKNLDYDYLGLSHYRRYFSLHKKNDDLNSVLTLSEAMRLLNKYKVIVPKKRRYYIESLYSHYAHTFDGHHLDVTRKVLEQKYPEYLSAFDIVMKQTSGYMFNMFIMPRDLCDIYFSWLFDVLAELNNRIDAQAMTDFEKRYIGRISERLFNVWLLYMQETNQLQKDDIHEIPYMYLGKINWCRKIAGFLGAKLFHKKYDRSF